LRDFGIVDKLPNHYIKIVDSPLGSFISELALVSEMKTVLFVHGNPPISKLPKADKIIALDTLTSQALSAAGITHSTPAEYDVPNSNNNAVDFLNEWSNKPLQAGRTIKDALAADNFSFWWCMEQWLFYSYLYRDPFSAIIEAVDTVQAVLKREKPETVAYFNDGTLYSKVIPLASKGAALKAVRRPRPVRRRLAETFRPFAIKQFFRAHAAARRLYWKLERLRSRAAKPARSGKRVLIAFAYQWRMVDHPALSSPMLGDPYTTPIGEQLTEHQVTYVDCVQRVYAGFDALRHKARAMQRHVLLEQYLSIADALRARSMSASIRRAARNLEREPKFLSSWKYSGIDIWQLVAPQFRCYFTHRLEGHAVDYWCVRRLLEHEKPDAVIYPAEGGDLAAMFYKLCADKRIPCIGLQHGTLPYNPLTVHAAKEICTGKPGCLPLPDMFLLYGPYYKRFLMENAHYPASKMRVIGNLRYDHFTEAKKLSRDKMAAKYGLDAGRPIVLYATQMMPSPAEGDAITRAICSATKQLGWQLIIKLHPGEPADSSYRMFAKEAGIEPLIIRDASTLELLTASDAIIGSESTLDYEAMMLGKPVIVMNLTPGRKDWLPFVAQGAALGVYRPEDTIEALNAVLAAGKKRDSLLENARKLVEDHCYKIDGKAAERAAAAVREVLA
jgi:surface carbohydrate biosynthesis protein (TIGR04326 family)